LTVQDLEIGGGPFPITWRGGGSSNWTNVSVNASTVGGIAIGWWDIDSAPANPKAVHYWFGSEVEAHGGTLNVAFFVQSSETWFYGGEVSTDASGLPSGTSLSINAPVYAISVGDFRAFGSAVEAEVGSACGTGTVHGVRALGASLFRMHGGNIKADALSTAAGCTTAIHATAVEAADTAQANTPGTAFQVAANGTGGVASRLKRSGLAQVSSPFLWPPGTQPPAIASITGADLFVETDCAEAVPPPTPASCNGVGTATHMMIYSQACPTPNPWFDATQGACRP
jgi:hypothetical protein